MPRLIRAIVCAIVLAALIALPYLGPGTMTSSTQSSVASAQAVDSSAGAAPITRLMAAKPADPPPGPKPGSNAVSGAGQPAPTVVPTPTPPPPAPPKPALPAPPAAPKPAAAVTTHTEPQAVSNDPPKPTPTSTPTAHPTSPPTSPPTATPTAPPPPAAKPALQQVAPAAVTNTPTPTPTATATPTPTAPPAAVVVVTATPTATPEERHHHHHHDNDNNGNDNNSNDNDDNNNNSNDNNGNDNDDNNNNSNDNDDNGNENVAFIEAPALAAPALALPIEVPSTVAECYAPQQVGNLQLTMSAGTATFNAPSGGFPQETQVVMQRVDPALAPPTAGPRLGDIVFNLGALGGCNGTDLSQLPAPSNLGIAYNVDADRSHLRIAVLLGNQWVDVPTTPDPVNPFVSATVQSTGTYTVYQAP